MRDIDNQVMSMPPMTFEEIKEGFDNIEDIENLEDVLCEMAMDEFEPYQAAKSVRADIRSLESEEEYHKIDLFFIGIFGWSLETLLKRTMIKESEAKDDDEDLEDF